MSILQNSNAISAGGYDVNNSLRFRASASAYLSRTPASAGSRTTWTWSAWVKRGALGSPTKELFTASTGGEIFFGTGDTLTIYDNATTYLTTTQVFRDPSAWYHLVIVWDTTQATAANRIKMYVNGSQVTAFSTSSYPAQNTTSSFNNNTLHNIGEYFGGGSYYFDGYMADINFIDGSAKTPSDFGETDTTTGVWKPKAYTGTYGTNGFYLKFSDIATTSGSNAGLGKDFSGNANYWTTNNISVTSGTTYDAMIDSPTNASSGTRPVGNYAVINPLSNLDATTLAAGNLNLTLTSNSSSVFGTLGVSSGKWYWEIVCYDGVMAGVADTQRSGGTYPGNFANSCAWNTFYSMSTNLYQSGTFAKNGSPSNAAATAGQIIGVALDMDAGNLYYYVNGSVANSGSAVFNTITGTVFPVFRGSTTTSSVNFGQRPFSYTPPTGYQALCTTNLPTPTILQGNKYMDATLWTGNSTAGRLITNAALFKPDFVWIKVRSNANENDLFDTVRGAGSYVRSNSTNAEATNTNTLSAFNSNGFTVGTDSEVNESPQTYVGWQWQAGQGTNSTNTSGSITSTVSVSTTAGFSVVTWTATGSNATIGHGLGVAPKMIITKGRNAVNGWNVYTSTTGNGNYLRLDTTAASTSGSTYWNNTSPTSTVFSTGTWYSNTETYVAYCFAAIPGYSAFGNYTGNGSADGPFIATNFAPKYVMIKSSSDAGTDWWVMDSVRSEYNIRQNLLSPNTSSAENASVPFIDFLSNGFKIRTATSGWNNTNGSTYIYACFASDPFSSNNRAR